MDFHFHVIFPCVRVDFHAVTRNFYVRTSVKFTFANKTEVMHERLFVSVKVEPRSTCRLSSALFISRLFDLRD